MREREKWGRREGRRDEKGKDGKKGGREGGSLQTVPPNVCIG